METKIIGSKIAKARKEINISQAQLAEKLFISPQAVGKWERGESVPDLVTFNRLATILGVDLNYFSDSFPSVNAETVTVDALPKAPVEKQGNQRSWDMSGGNWVDADFSGLKNLHEKFSGSNMQRCKFIGAVMPELLLKGNHIDSCDFRGADLRGSRIQESYVVKGRFNDAVMVEAELSGSHVKNCDFTGADFTGAKFTTSDFTKNTVVNATWVRTSFIATQISDVVINGELTDCYFENCSFARVTFERATLLNTFFKGRTLKHLHFVDCHADRMTYEFLKNGKANLDGLTVLNPEE
ncbi:pentapeptide repeat-containing protein [uncultured Chitinophaga sp.]|uniref:pentapeptide repeat-containing protein n=1 Tax=uncultured Chitinophaga sp. TaxID=339340 RepID=UPI0025E46B35|nr:pentapeptide repeat-containing protein [uncultured Chitinophaga sp.]